MKTKKIFVWSHHDLDGLVSCLAVKWAHPNHTFDYQPLTGFSVREDVTRWMLKHKFEDFEKIFIADLDVADHKDLFDKKNVFIVDHHKSHVERAKYENAVAIIKEYPSACLLLYKIFKKLYNVQFTEAQKLMIVLGNDYDSYKHEIPESKMLNSIFWNTQKNFDTFMKLYANGFHGFTRQQLAIHSIYKKDLEKTVKQLKLFESKDIAISGRPRHVVAAFASSHINDIADYIFDNYKPEIAIVVNLGTKHVSFRRSNESDVPLHKLAEKIADGGGHEFSAGGFITDKFMDFTKLLVPKNE